ncbi:MAG: LmeA family phospholipid-binding protein [Actinomycetota bacterium]
MFILRRIVYFLAIPILLFVGGSVVVESFAESQLANGMRSTLDLKERPSVQIESFPILYRVFQGRIPRVLVEAETFVIEGLEIAELTIDMEGVKTSFGTLVRQNRFDLTIEKGSGNARITQTAINAFLAREKKDVVVTLGAGEVVTVTADEVIAGTRHRFVATGKLKLGGRVLTFTPTRTTMDGLPVPSALRPRARRETTFSVEIPKLPAGITASRVVVSEGQLALIANLDDFVLKVR